MPDSTDVLHIQLLGPLTVTDAQGKERAPKGKKSQAVLAMLCTARNGRRSRAWLQANLWSDRSSSQAAGSLRSCLHDIRNEFDSYRDVLGSGRTMVEIDLSRVDVDVISMSSTDWLDTVSFGSEFLEGLDIADNQFNAWLTEQRQHWSKRTELPHRVPQGPDPAETRSAAATPYNLPVPQISESAIAEPVMTETEQVVPVQAINQPDWSLSLTVLPLENKTGDETNRFACHGLSEDLIQNLQQLRWLPVVGSAASFIYNNHNGRQGAAVADGMGAHYFVDGALSMQRNSRIGYFRLSEAETSRVIWSESYDLEPLLAGNCLNSVFDEIVSAIERSVSLSIQRRVMQSDNRNEAFYDQIWRGRWHLARLTKQDSELAHGYFQHSPAAAATLVGSAGADGLLASMENMG